MKAMEDSPSEGLRGMRVSDELDMDMEGVHSLGLESWLCEGEGTDT